MYNASFYPTPAPVAERMIAMLGERNWWKLRVLEPSAGKGDLADALIESMRTGILPTGRRITCDRADMAASIHCIEPVPDLQAALRGKGYRLVAYDFLTFCPEEPYDLIIMNPPFADADRHVLHAWEILEKGDVLSLVNAETLRNPCTERRRLLARVIEEHGRVEYFGACFEEAERTTAVEVACILLHKEGREDVIDLSVEDFGQDDPYAAFTASSGLESEVATRNMVDNLVRDYNQCLQKFREVSVGLRELGIYMQRIYGAAAYNVEKEFANAVGTLLRDAGKEASEAASLTFRRQLRPRAWSRLFELTSIGNLVSEGVRRTLDNFEREQQGMAFSRENISVLLQTLIQSRANIMRECVVEVFDGLTRYHEKNRVHVEGWKTNDAWKVNERFILPGIIEGHYSYYTLNYNSLGLVRDIDRVMASLEGRNLKDVSVTIEQALRDALQQTEWSGVLVTSTYFEMRAYCKGTVHFKFRDRSLWERFNLLAARGKNWLPDDYKAREKAEKARHARADQYGLPL
ncbi:DUF4942 domain-containing protein [uncultured Desulfovibrio sp.]|uniref:class I SAM-dependent methyltransferase n=1 Tax=uncultured Desulfovibrio sp. TaxID=167968 RepID=UPI00261F31FC|nr:DUF4942 domain-containing protein [uncultured Desulfovibrio sp.]